MTEKRNIPTTNEINSFMHCRNCIGDLPPGMSPRRWARLEAGFTAIGLQIRCVRCDLNIIHIDFEGAKHPANLGK